MKFYLIKQRNRDLYFYFTQFSEMTFGRLGNASVTTDSGCVEAMLKRLHETFVANMEFETVVFEDTDLVYLVARLQSYQRQNDTTWLSDPVTKPEKRDLSVDGDKVPWNIVEDEIAPKARTFQKELEYLINKYSIENGGNTPDFILAKYLHQCLTTFSQRVPENTHVYDSVARTVPTVCFQCGQDAFFAPIILVDGQLRRIHLGLCNAKLHLAHRELAKQSDLSIEFLNDYIAKHDKSSI